jgi:hypothetical protein
VHTCANSEHVEPSGGASGQASDIAIHAKEILRVRQALTEVYQRHCGLPDENAEDGMKRFGARPTMSLTLKWCSMTGCVQRLPWKETTS